MQLGLLLHLLPLTSCHGLAAAHRLRGGAALTLPPLVGAYQSALAAAPIHHDKRAVGRQPAGAAPSCLQPELLFVHAHTVLSRIGQLVAHIEGREGGGSEGPTSESCFCGLGTSAKDRLR